MAGKAVITDYFRKNKKDAETVQNNNREKILSSSEQFYRMYLAQQNSSCNNTSCFEIVSKLESQIKDVQAKIQNTKDAIVTCQSVISQKNCKIEKLEKKLTSMNVASVCVANNNRDSISGLNRVLIFDEFSSDFTSSQLADLRQVGNAKREDSTFILIALKNLYEKNLETLETKSLTGRSKPGQRKEKMTPEKTAILAKIFQNRLQHATADTQERVSREKCLNKLIKDAKDNITKSLHKQTTEKEIGRRLMFSENSDSG